MKVGEKIVGALMLAGIALVAALAIYGGYTAYKNIFNKPAPEFTPAQIATSFWPA